MKATILITGLALAATAAAQQPEPGGGKADPAAGLTASRFHLEEIDTYISQAAANFSISKRATDPFALFQDPQVKPKQPVATQDKLAKRTHIAPTPFADVVKAIRVSAVLPAQQCFLVGSRSIRRGDQFPIHYRDKAVKVQVTRVGSTSITFRNVGTGESAKLSLDVVPPGLTPGAADSKAPPGVVLDNRSAPIEVQVPEPNPLEAAQR